MEIVLKLSEVRGSEEEALQLNLHSSPGQFGALRVDCRWMGSIVLIVSACPKDNCQTISRSQRFESAEFSKVLQECRKVLKL